MSEVVTSVARVRYESIGTGTPVLALHGAYSAHQEVRAFLDPVLPERRRIYPDLPGHGSSTAEGVHTAADAVTALEELLEGTIGDEPVAVVGHSFGAHLARGLAARRPDQVRGLALVCPMVPDDMHEEQPTVVTDDGVAATLPPEQAAEFTGYFVVRTSSTVARFREAVAPVLGRYDGDAVERQMTSWQHDPDPSDVPFAHPVLLLAGRHDAFVGHRQQTALLEAYPRATSIVLADAGHALPHEQPEALASAIGRWIRCTDSH